MCQDAPFPLEVPSSTEVYPSKLVYLLKPIHSIYGHHVRNWLIFGTLLPYDSSDSAKNVDAKSPQKYFRQNTVLLHDGTYLGTPYIGRAGGRCSYIKVEGEIQY